MAVPRVYERKFDYDEARRLFNDGALVESLAKIFGVSESRIKQVVTVGEMERRKAYALARRDAQCEVCGVRVNRFSKKKPWQRRLCKACAHRERQDAYWALRVREDELLCSHCKRWKPDSEFGRGGPVQRRGLMAWCRRCSSAARADWRRRFPEKEREAQRRYKQQQRMRARESSEV